MDKQKHITEGIIVGIQFAGGLVGGVGNYQLQVLNNGNNLVGHKLPAYGFLGSLAGLIGSAIIIWRLKKDFAFNQIFVMAIACGLSFPLVLSGIADLVSLKSQVIQLQNANVIEQQQSIETIQELAANTADPQVKKEAVEKIAKIAKRSDSEEVVEDAIAAIDNADNENKDTDVLLVTIANLEKLAIDSESDDVKNDIIDNLNQYRRNYGTKVANRAAQAITKIENSN